MNIEQEKERKKKAILFAAIFHVVLIALFLFPALITPIPLPEEIGVEISMASLGDTYTGSGEVTPTNVAPTPTTNQTNTTDLSAAPATAQPSPQEEVATDDQSDVAVNEPVKEPAPKKTEPVKQEPVKEVEPEKVVNKKALYPGKTSDNASKSGGSKGNSTGAGNQGSATGRPEGKGALGGGQGSWELSGRSLVRGASISDTKEAGIVVLNIWVDRYGNVLRSTPNLKESNTASEYLFGLAKKAASQTQYSPKGDAAVEQRGKMTFVFILQ